MSCPDVNIVPAPERMTTRTWSSASARINAWSSSTRSGRCWALRYRGRLRMTRTIVAVVEFLVQHEVVHLVIARRFHRAPLVASEVCSRRPSCHVSMSAIARQGHIIAAWRIVDTMSSLISTSAT